MADILSQAELDALLGGLDEEAVGTAYEYLSVEDQDVLGEVGNINMGTSATTLSTLLSHKVNITTPKVTVQTWGELSNSYDRPAVGVKVGYREGLRGSNILILTNRDVKIIADLMMGGTGDVPEPIELNDLDMSAIGEAMNQMVGSASTSLSSMVSRKVDIDTPYPFVLDFQSDAVLDTIGFGHDERIACVAFSMEVEGLIDSEIMQIMPVDFAQELVGVMKTHLMGGATQTAAPPIQAAAPSPQASAPPPQYQAPPPQAASPQYQAPTQAAPPPQEAYAAPPPGYAYPPPQGYAYPPPQYQAPPPPPQNVQAAHFQPFDINEVYQQKENMGIIMDVPLDITVELGRTHRKISEILEFSPGTIIELPRLAGEPLDILVNGKHVAKGEVVIIEENFGIRVTDIVNVEKRL